MLLRIVADSIGKMFTDGIIQLFMVMSSHWQHWVIIREICYFFTTEQVM